MAGQDLEAHALGGEVVHGIDEMAQVAPEAVELPDDQHVALAQGFEAGRQAGAVVAPARGQVLIEVLRSDPCRQQCITLQIEGLTAIRFRDAHVAQVHTPPCPVNARLCDMRLRTPATIIMCHIIRHLFSVF